jgi:glutaconyl-CoA/methylmalonyl-CoA decarboxylase subunit gamma
MPTFDVTIGGKCYHVEVSDPGGTPLEVIVDGQTFSVDIAGAEAWTVPHSMPGSGPSPLSPSRRSAQPRANPPACASGEEIIAPMPGTILSIDVQPGQEIEGGQVVCVLEAMKMKNPIRACRAGVVIETAVQAGQNVAYGDLLVRLS